MVSLPSRRLARTVVADRPAERVRAGGRDAAGADPVPVGAPGPFAAGVVLLDAAGLDAVFAEPVVLARRVEGVSRVARCRAVAELGRPAATRLAARLAATRPAAVFGVPGARAAPSFDAAPLFAAPLFAAPPCAAPPFDAAVPFDAELPFDAAPSRAEEPSREEARRGCSARRVDEASLPRRPDRR